MFTEPQDRFFSLSSRLWGRSQVARAGRRIPPIVVPAVRERHRKRGALFIRQIVESRDLDGDERTADLGADKAGEALKKAGVTIARLNVGGGFPSHRLHGVVPQLDETFALIDRVTGETFGDNRPLLVCEPGRAICGDAFTLAARVKAVRDGSHVFLNDGVYGALTELPLIGVIDRVAVVTPEGQVRGGPLLPRIVFGPTCDSVDRLPGEVPLAADIAEGDFVVVQGMGAYSTVTNTRFNGFGELALATVLSQRL